MSRGLCFWLLLICLTGNVWSQIDPGTAIIQRKSKLLGTCFRHQRQLDLTEADLRKVELTIRKAEELVGRAQAARNAAAEQTARRALRTAEEARAKHLARRQAVATSLAKTQALLALPEKELLALEMPDSGDDPGFQPALQREQAELARDYAGWARKYQRLMREPESAAATHRSASIVGSLQGKPVPLPYKPLPKLEVGDVLLVDPEPGLGERLRGAEAFADKFAPTASSGNSSACHTLVFLKEVNGQRFFLDNQRGEGPRIIPESVFLERYGHRFLNKAAFASRNADGIYVAERLSTENAKQLWTAAMQAHHKGNQDRLVIRNPLGKDLTLGTGYGAFADDMVCSETSRWALMRAGRQVPEAGSPLKKALHIQFGPADFFDPRQPFLITPLGTGFN